VAKHRRPTRVARIRSVGSPLHLSIAAGVAGTVAVTGTVVASAADGGSTTVRTTLKDGAAPATTTTLAPVGFVTDGEAAALRDAVTAEVRERAERLAAAKARAIAERKAERRAARLAEQRREAEHRREAEQRAERARELQTASRSVERMSASAANVLNIAAQVVASGAYYTYGGSGPSGFDCSGFTSYVFAKVGINLPRTSSAQRAVARPVSSPQPGDLVFVYNGPGGSIGHVGIYAGGGYWWEAANPSTGVGKHRAWSSNVSYGRVL